MKFSSIDHALTVPSKKPSNKKEEHWPSLEIDPPFWKIGMKLSVIFLMGQTGNGQILSIKYVWWNIMSQFENWYFLAYYCMIRNERYCDYKVDSNIELRWNSIFIFPSI